MTNVLRVRNEAQRILLEKELKGQLSDGHWENARPFDHWQPWCDAVVVVDPTNVGRNFYARRDNYNFTSREMLTVLRYRMLRYVQHRLGEYTMEQMLADLRDLKEIFKTTSAKASDEVTETPLPQPTFATIPVEKMLRTVAVYARDTRRYTLEEALDRFVDSFEFNTDAPDGTPTH